MILLGAVFTHISHIKMSLFFAFFISVLFAIVIGKSIDFIALSSRKITLDDTFRGICLKNQFFSLIPIWFALSISISFFVNVAIEKHTFLQEKVVFRFSPFLFLASILFLTQILRYLLYKSTTLYLREKQLIIFCWYKFHKQNTLLTHLFFACSIFFSLFSFGIFLLNYFFMFIFILMIINYFHLFLIIKSSHSKGTGTINSYLCTDFALNSGMYFFVAWELLVLHS